MKRHNGTWINTFARSMVLPVATVTVGRDRPGGISDRIDRACTALSGDTADLDLPLGRVAAVLDSVTVVESPAARDALVERLVNHRGPLSIGFVNAHALNLVWRDVEVAREFLKLDLLLRDGIGLKILMKRLCREPGLNMNGTDFIPQLLAANRARSVAIYGTDEPWLTRAASRLNAAGHVITDTCDGFQEDGFYVRRMEVAPADLVILAMGMPKQERIAGLLKEQAQGLLICGGAIIDFMSNRYRRAPVWMRRHNLEWIFRLSTEPRRLFVRYFVGNATFLWRTSFLPGRTPNRLALMVLRWAR